MAGTGEATTPLKAVKPDRRETAMVENLMMEDVFGGGWLVVVLKSLSGVSDEAEVDEYLKRSISSWSLYLCHSLLRGHDPAPRHDVHDIHDAHDAIDSRSLALGLPSKWHRADRKGS